MYIWKGFGCGILNQLAWADPNHSNVHCLELDNSIAALKSQPHSWQLFKKSPSVISKEEPQTLPAEKSVTRKRESHGKENVQILEKQGLPQPMAPYDHIKIMNWWFLLQLGMGALCTKMNITERVPLQSTKVTQVDFCGHGQPVNTLKYTPEKLSF